MKTTFADPDDFQENDGGTNTFQEAQQQFGQYDIPVYKMEPAYKNTLPESGKIEWYLRTYSLSAFTLAGDLVMNVPGF